ncbi:glycine receptor subunit alpha-2-like [Branchiostoma floridae x Branchiostoma japonicum]
MKGMAALSLAVFGFLVPTVQPLPAVVETLGTRKREASADITIDTPEGEIIVNDTKMKFITVPEGYDNKTRPGPSAPDVDCSIHVLKLGPFLEKDMLFPISYYFACKWTDTRLKVPDNHTFAYVDESAGSVWKPLPYPMPMSDTIIREEFVEPPLVIAGGTVYMLKKYTFNAPCVMKLYSFPHDQQFCNVPIMMRGGVKASWGAMMYWPVQDQPILMNMQAFRSVFRVEYLEFISWAGSTLSPKETCIYQKGFCDYGGSEDCHTTSLRCTEAENQNKSECINCSFFGGKCKTYQTPNCSSVLQKVDEFGIYWTNLELRLKLTRRLGYHILHSYIPSMSVVGMSWVSFWIDPSSAPARTGLGVTTVLTMVTLSGKVGGAPELNYIRAIDVWMLTCKLFVILALLEYACVNFTALTQKRKVEQMPEVDMERQTKKEVGQDLDLYDCDEKKPPPKFSVSTLTAEKVNRSVDHVSRVAFPAAFAIFVCAYFSFYLADSP